MIEIRVEPQGKGITAGQQIRSPAVYLDHWALRKASDDTALGIRLAQAIIAKSGTLMLSWANLFEFVGLDQSCVRRAEEFIERLMPSLYFLEFNPYEVIQREKSFVPNVSDAPPHADMDLLKLVFGLEPNGLKPITCRGLLDKARQAKGHSIPAMKRIFVDRVEQLRAEYSNDSNFRLLVNRLIANPADRGTTELVLREFVAGLMRDKSAPIRDNDGMDFFHTVVPILYADFCLLDGRWRDQVDRLGQRLKKSGVRNPLATAISGEDAVERLIVYLDGYTAEPSASADARLI